MPRLIAATPARVASVLRHLSHTAMVLCLLLFLACIYPVLIESLTAESAVSPLARLSHFFDLDCSQSVTLTDVYATGDFRFCTARDGQFEVGGPHSLAIITLNHGDRVRWQLEHYSRLRLTGTASAELLGAGHIDAQSLLRTYTVSCAGVHILVRDARLFVQDSSPTHIRVHRGAVLLLGNSWHVRVPGGTCLTFSPSGPLFQPTPCHVNAPYEDPLRH